ncbi:MAG TPA: ABC transporter permease [Pyrinomonadaceae bacterium]|nr:ABC transporter permease [Pyrinomonadaceae bacterium]
MNLGAIAAITRKDIIDAIRNRYLLTALLTPLFVALLFRVLLPGVNNKSVLTLVVHDSGNSAMIAELRRVSQISVVDSPSAEATESEVQNRKAIGGLVVPVNFDADATAGKQPELKIYVNNKKTIFEQAALRRLLDQQVRALVKQPEPVNMVWIDVNKESSEQGLTLDQMLLPLLLLLTLGMIGAMVVPLLLVEEKEKRTLDFLLSSPASLKDIVAGKALTGIAYTVLIAGLLLVLNRHFIANWSLMVLSVLLGLVFVVAVGLFMGSLLNNTMQVNTWAGTVLILLMAPSFPSFGLPAAVDTAMRFVPTYYLTKALELSMEGNTTSRIWGHLAVVLVCTVIAFLAAAWTLRRPH